MMRDDRQLNAVCVAVCRRIGKPGIWRSTGPTELAWSWLESSPLSSGEHVLLQVAFSLYNGTSTVLSLSRVLEVLGGGHLVFLGSLLVAMGGGAGEVDRWLESQGVRNG